MNPIEIFPSTKKRLLILAMITVFALLIAFLVPMSSTIFIFYFSLCAIAFVYLVVRLFDSRPLLILSDDGIQSRMTMNGQKIGLISWKDIAEIRETRSFGVLKGIELHADREVAQRYQSKLKKAELPNRETFLMYLTSEEANLSYKQLLTILIQYWTYNKGGVK